ncbi:hypothetical protein ACFSYG_09530 [Leeuwenhoekiella polynyae]|uniref:Uncharacterized protein n=1 Tax=Leeuwenhoekiella polynyae TaxID=1550906 RepID=A0A4Q0PGC8_9FLAO|nr:hypothetical protein [Leeuwenhoekiella polynyae]RXG26042.1 hypothetical protein DSM02_33 [Leeuwenhoekiella polynyae]
MKPKLTPKERQIQLAILYAQLNDSLGLIKELKGDSVSRQKYERGATEQDINKFLEQSLERVEELLGLN